MFWFPVLEDQVHGVPAGPGLHAGEPASLAVAGVEPEGASGVPCQQVHMTVAVEIHQAQPPADQSSGPLTCSTPAKVPIGPYMKRIFTTFVMLVTRSCH